MPRHAKSEARCVITMYVAPETVGADPGPLLGSEGESDQRYAGRVALLEELLAIPDTDPASGGRAADPPRPCLRPPAAPV